MAEQLDTDAETLLYGPEKSAERNAGAAGFDASEGNAYRVKMLGSVK